MSRKSPLKRNSNQEGDSRLLQAIIGQQSAHDILKLIERDPKAVRCHDATTKEYPLHAACCRSDQPQYDAVIRKLLEIFPEAAQHKNRDGNYAFHIACRHIRQPSDDVLVPLLELFPEAASIQTSYDNMYALHLACAYNRSEELITKLIHIYPTALREKDSTLQYPIYYALSNNPCLDLIRLFVMTDPFVLQQTNKSTRTPFHQACCWFKVPVVDYLLQKFPDNLSINTQDIDGMTPLLSACASGYEEIVDMLLDHPNINVNMTDRWGCTALHAAMTNCDGDQRHHIVTKLLQHPDVNVNKSSNRQNTTLHIAVQDDDYENGEDIVRIVQLLLQHPCMIVNQKDYRSETPLDVIQTRLRNLNNYGDDDDEKWIIPYYENVERLLMDHPIQRKWQSYQYLFDHMNDWSDCR